jgi:hypothetical protein
MRFVFPPDLSINVKTLTIFDIKILFLFLLIGFFSIDVNNP